MDSPQRNHQHFQTNHKQIILCHNQIQKLDFVFCVFYKFPRFRISWSEISVFPSQRHFVSEFAFAFICLSFLHFFSYIAIGEIFFFQLFLSIQIIFIFLLFCILFVSFILLLSSFFLLHPNNVFKLKIKKKIIKKPIDV